MLEGFETAQANEVHYVHMTLTAFRRLEQFLRAELPWQTDTETLDGDGILLKSINDVFSVSLLLRDRLAEMCDMIAFFARELRVLYVFTRDF